ncbi:acyl carrier protein [Actinomadura madurae]|uniref:acyl carrier protein n=1 Tax=Actinomadura madurae TaxID=1993 RepID=UPI0020D26225|nr:acyl carrier protein [Actinomadura madurae]MCQ0021217.1 acyl carrier protein [Actinomadura madurae]
MDPTAAVPKEADGSVPALLSGFVPSAPGGADGSVPAAALESALAGRPAEEQEKTLTALVRAEAASTLGHAGAGEVGEDQAFSDLGFDSLAAVELRNRLNRVTGLRLPATALFDHPTPRALARRIRAEMAPDAAPGAAGILAELDRFEKLLAAWIPTRPTWRESPPGSTSSWPGCARRPLPQHEAPPTTPDPNTGTRACPPPEPSTTSLRASTRSSVPPDRAHPDRTDRIEGLGMLDGD